MKALEFQSQYGKAVKEFFQRVNDYLVSGDLEPLKVTEMQNIVICLRLNNFRFSLPANGYFFEGYYRCINKVEELGFVACEIEPIFQ